jgi:hypothetical protein
MVSFSTSVSQEARSKTKRRVERGQRRENTPALVFENIVVFIFTIFLCYVL